MLINLKLHPSWHFTWFLCISEIVAYEIVYKKVHIENFNISTSFRENQL